MTCPTGEVLMRYDLACQATLLIVVDIGHIQNSEMLMNHTNDLSLIHFDTVLT
jgi:hypothetical protein